MDQNNYELEWIKQPPKSSRSQAMTPDEYEKEKQFVLGELADTKFSTVGLSHEILKDWVQPFVDDKEVMLASLVNNSYIANEASARLKADKEFMIEAVQSCSGIFKEATAELRDDIEVVQQAAWAESSSFQYASDRIRSTPALIAICCADSSRPLNAIHPSVRDNPSTFLELLREIEPHHKPSAVLNYASEEIQGLVGNADPVKFLQAHLLHEKLNNACSPKVEVHKPKMKI
mgnify:CR=1 FL=1